MIEIPACVESTEYKQHIVKTKSLYSKCVTTVPMRLADNVLIEG